MYRRLSRRTAILFMGIAIVNIILDFVLMAIPTVSPPGMLSSAFSAGVVSLWALLLGRYIRDLFLILLSLVTAVIMIMAFMGITSYLFSAAISAALIYLLLTEYHAES